jgi:hypothetical protein
VIYEYLPIPYAGKRRCACGQPAALVQGVRVRCMACYCDDLVAPPAPPSYAPPPLRTRRRAVRHRRSGTRDDLRVPERPMTAPHQPPPLQCVLTMPARCDCGCVWTFRYAVPPDESNVPGCPVCGAGIEVRAHGTPAPRWDR